MALQFASSGPRLQGQQKRVSDLISEAGWLSRGRLPTALERVLLARGFNTPELVDRLMNPSLKDLRDPFSILNMERAVERLLTAWHSQEAFAIYADFDLDGTSGLALLSAGLWDLGFKKAKPFQPLRLADGYGFHSSAVEKLAGEGIKLIVTIDVGITGFEACKRAQELGVDVIVTDHHLPLATLPSAYTIINPNQADDRSGLGHLSGAGVALYLYFALRKRLRELSLLSPQVRDPKELLDCFTIGTLTDMVPLVQENRALVKHGLMQLAQTRRPALKSLLDVVGLAGKKLRSEDVGFSIAPKLNALSRLEEGLLPFDILCETDVERAGVLAKELVLTNERRRSLQEFAEKNGRLMHEVSQPVLWIWSQDFHKGVVGLVATKLAQEFSVPAFVGALGADGVITGSARLPVGHQGNLVEMMSKASELLKQFGGHAQAAGFKVSLDHAEALRNRLSTAALAADDLPSTELTWDVDVESSELNLNLVEALDHLEPFGQAFPVPRFRLRAARLESVRALKGGQHLKLEISRPQGSLGAIYFNAPLTLAEKLGPGSVCEIIGEIQSNEFRGQVSPQLRVALLRPLSV